MKKLKSISIFVCVFCYCFITTGCNRNLNEADSAKFYYLNPNKSHSNIGRIAIVELQNDSSYPQISNDITEALFQTIQKRQVFGLTIVRQREPLWKSLQLEPDTTYSLEQMASVSQTLKCDGVLIGTITEYKPYPHMTIGLRLRLIDLTEGELLWAVEQVWSSSDKTTEKKIKKYLKETKGSSAESANERITAISPLEFIRFVSYEVAQTL